MFPYARSSPPTNDTRFPVNENGRAVVLAAVVLVSVVALSASVAGSVVDGAGNGAVALDDETVEGDITLEPGDRSTAFHGQVVVVEGLEPDERVDLRTADGDLVQQKQATDAGEVAVDTADLEPGDYVLENEDDPVEFDVVGGWVEVNATFVEVPGTADRGSVVDLVVNVEGTENVTVGLDGDGYEAVVDVTLEESGEFTLAWNTFLAGTGEEFVAVGDAVADLDVEVESEFEGGPADDLTSPQDVDLTVAPALGDAEADGGDATDGTTLAIEERSTDAVETWVAPSGPVEAVENRRAVERAIENDTLTRSAFVAEGDVLVTELDASGLDGVVAWAGDERVDDPTEAFLAAVEAGAFDLRFEQVNYGPMVAPVEIDVADVDDELLTVVPGESGYYVALELADFADEGALGISHSIHAGDEFETKFAVHPALEDEDALESERYGLVGPDEDGEFEPETVTAEWEAVGRVAAVETVGEELVVDAADGQEIAGETTLAPGTELVFGVESTNATETFAFEETATVTATGLDEPNAFVFETDFAETTPGDEFELRSGALAEDEFAPVSGLVADLGGSFVQLSGIAPDSETVEAGEEVDVSALATNLGGEETIATVRLLFEGDEVIRGSVDLDPGEAERVVFEDVAMDVDPGEYDYSVRTGDVEVSGTLTVSEPPEPFFEIVDHEPAGDLERGETAVVEATVLNTREGEATHDVALVVDGEALDVETVTLEGGEERALAFEVETGAFEPGEYDYTVSTPDDERDGTLTVEPAPAQLEVADLAAEGPFEVGEEAVLSATVTNVGDEGTTTVVDLRFAGTGLTAAEEVTLEGGEETTVVFEDVVMDVEPGEYDYTVSTPDEEATGTVTVEAGEEVDDVEAVDGADDDGAGFGVAVAALALLPAAAFALRRRRRR